MSGFDFDKHKAQCLAVARSFISLQNSKISFAKYETAVARATMLSPTVVMKIEREIIAKGQTFCPIDAYQF